MDIIWSTSANLMARVRQDGKLYVVNIVNTSQGSWMGFTLTGVGENIEEGPGVIFNDVESLEKAMVLVREYLAEKVSGQVNNVV